MNKKESLTLSDILSILSFNQRDREIISKLYCNVTLNKKDWITLLKKDFVFNDN